MASTHIPTDVDLGHVFRINEERDVGAHHHSIVGLQNHLLMLRKLYHDNKKHCDRVDRKSVCCPLVGGAEACVLQTCAGVGLSRIKTFTPLCCVFPSIASSSNLPLP